MDYESVSVGNRDQDRWRSRHRNEGSDPRVARNFASIESALVFDASVRRRLHPEVRRFAICLASVLQRDSSKVLVSEADIERWNIDVNAVVGTSDRSAYRQPWGVLSRELVKAKMLTDELRREKKKRHARLHLAPVYTNRRQSAPVERPTGELRDRGIATARVPHEYFRDERLGELDTAEVFTLVVVHALTDLGAYGGVDPAHIRVEQGRLHLSRQVCDAAGLSGSEVLEVLLGLEKAGYLVFVPVVWNEVEVPGMATTYEWVRDDGSHDAGRFIVRAAMVDRNEPRLEEKGWLEGATVRNRAAGLEDGRAEGAGQQGSGEACGVHGLEDGSAEGTGQQDSPEACGVHGLEVRSVPVTGREVLAFEIVGDLQQIPQYQAGDQDSGPEHVSGGDLQRIPQYAAGGELQQAWQYQAPENLQQGQQYQAREVGSSHAVVSDRVCQSMKSQVRKVAESSERTVRVKIVYEVCAERRVGLIRVAKVVTDALKNAGVIPDDHRTHLPEVEIRRGSPDRESRPYVDIKVADTEGVIVFERRVYVEPCEWRPAARRRESALAGPWASYDAFSEAAKSAAISSFRPSELQNNDIAFFKEIRITTTSQARFDLDNVALMVNSVITEALKPMGLEVPFDEIVDKVVLRHRTGRDVVHIQVFSR